MNPDPQSIKKKICPGPDLTVIRGCTNISRCREGISQMLKNILLIIQSPLTTFSVLFTVYLFKDFKPRYVLSDLADSPPVLEQYAVMSCEDI